MYSIKQLAQVIFFILVSMAITACSTGRLVKTYDDDLEASQVATLKSPESVEVISVNGQDVPTYMVSQLEINYGLKPGPNVVVFKYATVWAVPKKDQEDMPSRAVESGKKQFTLEARAGEVYTFGMAEATNVREAEKLSQNFKAELLDSQGNVVAQSEDYQKPHAKAANVAGSHSVPAMIAAPTVDAPAVDAGALPANEAIKVLWKTLSAEEKKAFLQWAFK